MSLLSYIYQMGEIVSISYLLSPSSKLVLKKAAFAVSFLRNREMLSIVVHMFSQLKLFSMEVEFSKCEHGTAEQKPWIQGQMTHYSLISCKSLIPSTAM